MAQVVLDASALLALLNNERGSEAVVAAMPDAVVSTVNLAEVIAKLAAAGIGPEVVRKALQELSLGAIPFDQDQAYEAGFLITATRQLGLSLGDRACLSLARTLGLPAMTADRAWEQLSIGVEVRLIR
jgi:PIN domain nuclease of toxin-antitoxin system